MEIVERQLDSEFVADLMGRSDSIGFLSIYVDADPVLQSHRRPAWKIAVENELREQESAVDRLDRDRSDVAHRRLREVRRVLEHRLDASAPGRGRAWFIPLSDGDAIEVTVQAPWPTTVRVEDRPYIVPLLHGLDRNGPVGVVAVSADEVRVLEVSGGLIEDVHRIDVRPLTDDWRRMKGPAAANPVRAQQTASQHDRYERRDRAVRRQDLGECAGHVLELGRKRGWRRAVVAGDPRYAEVIADAIRGADLPVITDARVLTGAPAAIYDMIGDVLDQAEREERECLADRVRSAAAADAAAVTDLAQTRAALEGGRVHHLLVEDGSDEAVAEDLIERAFSSGARVSVFEHGELGTPDGVGALLRW
jgi:hypothetical protein